MDKGRVGFATGMGRVAAIVGPVLVGYLMAAKVPLQEVLVFIAAPDIVVAVVCVGLDALRRRGIAADSVQGATVPQASGEVVA